MRKGRGNAVADAIKKAGGLTKAANKANMRYATLHAYKKAGAIRLAKPLFVLAEAAGINVDPRLKRLAGLEG